MTREELNEELWLEMLVSKEQDKMTDRLLELIVVMVDDHLERLDKKLNYRITPENREDVRLFAIMSCHNHIMKFNKDIMKQSGKAYSYVSIIIRCSFAGKLKKLSDEGRKITTVAKATTQ